MDSVKTIICVGWLVISSFVPGPLTHPSHTQRIYSKYSTLPHTPALDMMRLMSLRVRPSLAALSAALNSLRSSCPLLKCGEVWGCGETQILLSGPSPLLPPLPTLINYYSHLSASALANTRCISASSSDLVMPCTIMSSTAPRTWEEEGDGGRGRRGGEAQRAEKEGDKGERVERHSMESKRGARAAGGEGRTEIGGGPLAQVGRGGD